ncbi:MAG: cytochrome c-type biogenesis protein CcmH [Methylophilaceae bacterium]|nr:cytochrome c-type biogenesis protein CcmH [Methylophilaceae bacterium]MDG1445029.1 cytochrome c-type biogenesis protein CcmH [Methylophilaceae bacterium]
MMKLRYVLLTLVVTFSSLSVATDKPSTAATEVRLKRLSTELRCLVCQNSTLADSDAELAQDLRNEIRTLIDDGKTDEEVVAFLVARYGDFVTFRPPVNANTALLWFGPFIMLFIGALVLILMLKKRSAVLGAEP